MNIIRTLSMWWRERELRRRIRASNRKREPVPAPRQPMGGLPAFADRLGEQLQLARELADEVARADIESYCVVERLGTRDWYDTTTVSPDGLEFKAGIARAMRYLDLRDRVFRHPVQRHLVRFER